MYLGIKAVLAKSFSRIHKANLINFGVLPLEFTDSKDYESIKLGSKVSVENVINRLNGDKFTIDAQVGSKIISLRIPSSRRFKQILISGGLLNYTKKDLSYMNY